MMLAVGSRWRSDRRRTTALARSLYAHLLLGSPVWDGPHQVGVADPGALVKMLAGL
jgi:hypothetical protein